MTQMTTLGSRTVCSKHELLSHSLYSETCVVEFRNKQRDGLMLVVDAVIKAFYVVICVKHRRMNLM